jgi:DNA-binding transcriptional ArsR family regulator
MDANTFAALGEPSRLQIVELLRERPLSVGDVAEALTIRQPQVSKHLRVLREAGIVAVEPVARQRTTTCGPSRSNRSAAGSTRSRGCGRCVWTRSTRSCSRRVGWIAMQRDGEVAVSEVAMSEVGGAAGRHGSLREGM